MNLNGARANIIDSVTNDNVDAGLSATFSSAFITGHEAKRNEVGIAVRSCTTTDDVPVPLNPPVLTDSVVCDNDFDFLVSDCTVNTGANSCDDGDFCDCDCPMTAAPTPAPA